MKGFWPILKRELFSTWVTPNAWALLLVSLLLQGFSFVLVVDHFANQLELAVDQGPIQWFFGETLVVYLPLLMLPPALTMRAFAEERRAGTIEALLTAPVSTVAVVMAKWTAAFVTYLAVWVPTVLYVVILRQAGPVDGWVVASCYIGVALLGAAFVSVGLLASATAKSQLVALVLSLAATIGLFVYGLGAFVFEPGLVHDICAHVSIWLQMADFSKGLVDTRHIVFDVSLAVASLFATVRVVDAWRWG